MSYIAIKWSYTSPHVLHAGLKPSELATLRALCWCYNDKFTTRFDRNCYPGVKKLALMIGASTDSVDRAKTVLAKKGLISWNRAANFGKKRSTNSYTIECPDLQKQLKNNENNRLRGLPPDREYTEFSFPPDPGLLFKRPEPKTLAGVLKQPLNDNEADWLADALTFTGNSSENLLSLYGAMKRAPDLDTCRKTLRRVLTTSKKGRIIRNRAGYLIKALTGASA